MSIEAGVLIDIDRNPIHWHMPVDRSVGYLPDSRELWDVIWENRDRVRGFAHSHPGSGVPGPSMEDLTTFAATESGLGRKLVWWITSADCLVTLWWQGPGKFDYFKAVVPKEIELELYPWLEQLRINSGYENS